MKIKAEIQRFPGSAAFYYLHIKHEDAEKLGAKHLTRLVCTIGEYSFPCALMGLGQGDFYIMLSKNLRKQAGLGDEGWVQAHIKLDESEFGVEPCEELVEVLAQDEQGYKLFEQLSAGKKRSIIFAVARMKSTEARINKSLKLIEMLKTGELYILRNKKS